MDTLLVYKKSTYDIYVNEKKGVNLSQGDREMLKVSHDSNAVSIKAVEDALIQLGVCYKKTWRAESFDCRDFLPDLVIAVGGDGTFLEAQRIVHENTIILGVNSDPGKSYGHYCSANRGNALEAIRSVLNKTATVEKRWRLVLALDGEEHEFPAMNDILIHHSCPAGLTRYLVDNNKALEEHFCSGVWVFTPSGQTGAISSFDGPTLFDDSSVLGWKAFGLNKSKKKGYNLETGISERLLFTSKMREGMIYVDGQHVQIPFPYNSQLFVSMDDAAHVVTGFPV
jgi:NAD+ kinase